MGLREKIKIAIISTSLVFIISACGSNNDQNEKIGTGHYIDSAIKGVNYDCGNQEGVTDDNGTFRFEEGKECIFSLGNIVLRELNASQLKDKIVVIEEDINNARLLQSLDNDGNPDNGIEITKNVLDVITENNFTVVPVGDEFDSFFENIEGAEGYEGAKVTIDQAQRHLSQTVKSLGLEELLDEFPTQDDIKEITESMDLNL